MTNSRPGVSCCCLCGIAPPVTRDRLIPVSLLRRPLRSLEDPPASFGTVGTAQAKGKGGRKRASIKQLGQTFQRGRIGNLPVEITNSRAVIVMLVQMKLRIVGEAWQRLERGKEGRGGLIKRPCPCCPDFSNSTEGAALAQRIGGVFGLLLPPARLLSGVTCRLRQPRYLDESARDRQERKALEFCGCAPEATVSPP